MKKVPFLAVVIFAGVLSQNIFAGDMKRHHGMEKGSMVSSNDGGVIILSGNTLSKYDKDLNLVKEIQLKSETKEKKVCPMCGLKKKDTGEHESHEVK